MWNGILCEYSCLIYSKSYLVRLSHPLPLPSPQPACFDFIPNLDESAENLSVFEGLWEVRDSLSSRQHRHQWSQFKLYSMEIREQSRELWVGGGGAGDFTFQVALDHWLHLLGRTFYFELRYRRIRRCFQPALTEQSAVTRPSFPVIWGRQGCPQTERGIPRP